jgi:hypothetical protein
LLHDSPGLRNGETTQVASHQSSNLHWLRGDGGQEEARAVGRARGERRQAIAGTGDGAVAVVAGAGTGLKNAAEGERDEREDGEDLHFDFCGIDRPWVVNDVEQKTRNCLLESLVKWAELFRDAAEETGTREKGSGKDGLGGRRGYILHISSHLPNPTCRRGAGASELGLQ